MGLGGVFVPAEAGEVVSQGSAGRGQGPGRAYPLGLPRILSYLQLFSGGAFRPPPPHLLGCRVRDGALLDPSFIIQDPTVAAAAQHGLVGSGD